MNYFKTYTIKTSFAAIGILIFCTMTFISCGDKRTPGRTYMPDMAYSRAFEAYAPNKLDPSIHYLNYPVEGTIRRGDLFPYTLPNDSNGYKMSVDVKNPLLPIDSLLLPEAQRLYMINCGICHGPNMDAQGPLAVSGKIGGVANLKLKQFLVQPEGQMFHVATYGKGNMGSYASQLDRKQRWMVVHYIKTEQEKELTKNAAAGVAAADTAVKK